MQQDLGKPCVGMRALTTQQGLGPPRANSPSRGQRLPQPSPQTSASLSGPKFVFLLCYHDVLVGCLLLVRDREWLFPAFR